MQTQRRKVTYTDLESWPDDGRRYELYDGEVYVCPAPTPRHQLAVGELYAHLRAYAQRTGAIALFSPIDIVFTEHDVLQPDICFFRVSRRHFVTPDKAIRTPPDVVVEVISPSTVWNDLGRKKAAFARFGVPEYWLLDPHIDRIERYSHAAGEYERTLSAGPHEVFASAILGGFSCPVDSLFSW